MVLVQRGRTELSIFDEERQEVCKLVLKQGDLAVLAAGGHGFRMLEDTVLLDVKQGPFTGQKEKEHFAAKAVG